MLIKLSWVMLRMKIFNIFSTIYSDEALCHCP